MKSCHLMPTLLNANAPVLILFRDWRRNFPQYDFQVPFYKLHGDSCKESSAWTQGRLNKESSTCICRPCPLLQRLKNLVFMNSLIDVNNMNCHHLLLENKVLKFEIWKQNRILGFHALFEFHTQNLRTKRTVLKFSFVWTLRWVAH